MWCTSYSCQRQNKYIREDLRYDFYVTKSDPLKLSQLTVVACVVSPLHVHYDFVRKEISPFVTKVRRCLITSNH